MPLAQKKEETYTFRRARGLVLMRELRDFATFVGRKLGFKVSATGINIREIAGGIHFDVLPKNGSSEGEKLFELFDASADGTPFIRVTSSLLGGTTPIFTTAVTAFSVGDDPPCIFAPTTSTGFLWAHIEIDSTGTVITRELAFGDTMPASDDTNGYIQIGTWSITADVLTPNNESYGPIAVSICRNWFSYPTSYGITLTGSGA